MSKIELCVKSIKTTQKLESSLKQSLDSTLPTSKRDKNTQLEFQSLDFDLSLLCKLFPQCAKSLDSKIVGTLLASTNIVGMKTPGLHSIYSSLEFDFSKGHSVLSDKSRIASAESAKLESSKHTNATAEVSWSDFSGFGSKGEGSGSKANDQALSEQKLKSAQETTQKQIQQDNQMYYTHTTHPRLNLTTIRTIAPFFGTIKAFIRPIPLQNESFIEIDTANPNLAKQKPFATQKALVIGAGSGFGNTCAKMLLLGGAKVLATTYNKGFDEPHSNLHTLQYNATQANKEILKQFRAFNPTHIYYFATPKIRSTHTLDKKLFNEFLSFYIFGLHTILESVETSALSGIFQPSTCFVDELPLDMQAYTIAKSALETYALFLAKTYHCHIKTPRMQKSATNQTLSLIPQNLQKPSIVLLDEILDFSKGM